MAFKFTDYVEPGTHSTVVDALARYLELPIGGAEMVDPVTMQLPIWAAFRLEETPQHPLVFLYSLEGGKVAARFGKTVSEEFKQRFTPVLFHVLNDLKGYALTEVTFATAKYRMADVLTAFFSRGLFFRRPDGAWDARM